MRTTSTTGVRRRAVALSAVTALALSAVVFGASTSGATVKQQTLPSDAVVLTAPALKGIPAVPGHGVAAPFTISGSVGLLTVTPNQAAPGTPITVKGTGLPASSRIQLVWSTASATWVVEPQPDTVNYLGRSATDYYVNLATVTTSASGAFTYKMTVPTDFGGDHEIGAIVSGVEVDYGGLVIVRKITMTPSSGPVGTPITITYTGLGATEYTGGGSVLWDNHYVGEIMANWTRGVARFTIRAAGPAGIHFIQVGNAISYLYLNVPQSPIPYTNGFVLRFDTTRDDGPPAPSITWPANVAPTVSARTTLGAIAGTAKMSLSASRGPVDSKVSVTATGLSSNDKVTMQWATVVGNRVNCTSTCWVDVTQTLGTASASGDAVHASVSIPDGLGGWHVLQIVQDSTVVGQVPFYVSESIVGRGLSSIVVKEGALFTIHLKGVGWTQLDNTLAVDYDNSYMGYACGFNSNGDVVIDLHATGAPGTHIIDLYPMLYSLSPSFSNTPYGMVPVLTYAQDEPALALGYHIPSFHFAITVVK